MIIKDQGSSKKKSARKHHFWWLGLLFLVPVIYLSWPAARAVHTLPEGSEDLIFCDAEWVEDQDFVNGDHRFSNGRTQSGEASRSGQFSSKTLDEEGSQFGFTYDLLDPIPGQVLEISVWRYRPNGGKGSLVVAGIGDVKYYQEQSVTAKTDAEGWEKLQLILTTPDLTGLYGLKIYVYSSSPSAVYFDDLTIDRITENQRYAAPLLRISAKDKQWRKIIRKREEALKAGILETDDNDWVKAQMKGEEHQDYIPVQIRLKGDWLDHLRSEKWSFRIKVDDHHSWNRLKTFSIQTPEARDYLHEWLLHRLWKREDVLTTRYDFIDLYLNGKALGIYAYEEHFEKQLPEFNYRREGPIVRLDEQGFWAGIKRQKEFHDELQFGPVPEMSQYNATIRPFRENTTLNDPTLSKAFKVAQRLLQDYLNGIQKADLVFDTELLAKYFAICDVMGAYHGLVWHNQRFYYNPITSKLEPIGFDGFPKTDRFEDSFIGNGAMNSSQYIDFLFRPLFQDRNFFSKYINYLYQYTSRSYLEGFLEEVRPELDLRRHLLRYEYPSYNFNEGAFINRALRIHAQIQPLPEVSLKAYRQGIRENKTVLLINNHHNLPLDLVGHSRRADRIDHRFEDPIVLPGYQNRYPELHFVPLELDGLANFLFYKVVGMDSVFQTSIINWPLPEVSSPSTSLLTQLQLKNNPVYAVSDEWIIFQPGTHQISELITIPEGYSVRFPAGTHLDFVNGAGFISKSPVEISGTVEMPVRISSSDGSAMGFTVLQAKGKSTINYARFENLNTLNYQGWQLTGAVNFYESEVLIQHSSFRKNNCEDALNIIRSRFALDKIVISDTPFDGLDVDFGIGTIRNSRFINTSNDGMDFSGSQVQVSGVLLDNCRDKGISVGEASTVEVESATIQNSNIGVASKDLSKLVIHQIILQNCGLGFTAYQKKPEYGGAEILVHNYSAQEVNRLYNIPERSKLTLKGVQIKGN